MLQGSEEKNLFKRLTSSTVDARARERSTGSGEGEGQRKGKEGGRIEKRGSERVAETRETVGVQSTEEVGGEGSGEVKA